MIYRCRIEGGFSSLAQSRGFGAAGPCVSWRGNASREGKKNADSCAPRTPVALSFSKTRSVYWPKKREEVGLEGDIFLSLGSEPLEIYFRVPQDKRRDCVQNFNSAFG